MIGLALAWLVSDTGIKAVGLLAGAIYGAIKAKQGVTKSQDLKRTAVEIIGADVFRAVEGLARSGKLNDAIALIGGDAAARKLAKWTRGATMFAEGVRVKLGRPPTAKELEAFRVQVERLAATGLF